MQKCYCCGKDLINTRQKPEHIIPNGVGGKLKSSHILCYDCNNMLSYLDESICKSVLHLTNFLNPHRDNGTNPKIKIQSDSKEYIREANGKYYTKPEFKNVKKEGNHLSFAFKTEYSVDDKNSAQENALKPVFKLVEDFYKDKPEKIEKAKKDIIAKLEKNIVSKDSPVLHICGQYNQDGLLFLALLKITIGFYIYNELPVEDIADKIQLLKNKDLKSINNLGNYFYPDNFFLNDSIYHLLYLKGDSLNKQMYCIISLYSCLNTIILLNDNYTGDNFCKTYLYDLRNNKEKSFSNNITITKDMFENILSFNNQEQIQKGMCKQMKIFLDFLVRRTPTPDKFFHILNTSFQKICNSDCLSEDEYKKAFEGTSKRALKEDNDFKCFLDKWVDEILAIALSTNYSYTRYLSTYIPKVLSSIVMSCIFDIIEQNLYQIPSIDIFKDMIYGKIANVKTKNENLNHLIQDENENIISYIDSLLEEKIYPKIQNYLFLFEKSEFKT